MLVRDTHQGTYPRGSRLDVTRLQIRIPDSIYPLWNDRVGQIWSIRSWGSTGLELDLENARGIVAHLYYGLGILIFILIEWIHYSVV